ncbi:type II secretory pathway component GspD/PulD (secretin) [Candidatus Velamenicoccus archaeovorus]|uniref:Type II secretory pathway component GspD/PulD (Secretin) n=1 Tax=Velamenicoccus archaeovorus TaxID=1930593 RepID=A0A410P534_VELA1|nr:type IV pilus secretin PilQ [Candidatus Velamenicoccus archaeovorus]QAT17233.1 type II secretory pathway component GspD/PulD (secretin) [Candidatus Velamenicoccus archaeovorus]
MRGPRFCRMLLGVLFVFAIGAIGVAQEPGAMNEETTGNQEAAIQGAVSAAAAPSIEMIAAPPEEEQVKTDLITLDFKEANIRDVLKVISYKSGVNIVASPEVTGTVNVRITDVPWEKALDVILKTYGYAYDKQENIIMVAPLEKLTAQRKMEQDLAQVQPVATEVVVLQYIDAIDAQKAIEPQLSPRGKITNLEITGQAGWGFGGAFSEKRSRAVSTTSRSKTLIISDIPPVLERIKEVLKSIDVKPKLVLIETRIVEVSLDKLRDIGVDFATGGAGSSSSTTVTTDSITQSLKAGGHSFGGVGVTPAAFAPQATAITTANTGMNFVFQKLSGSEFEVTIHALEENVAANILSAPSILTLDNQEATILVGEQFPIVATTKSSDTSTTVDVSLESYKDIGIQLNVIPQVSGKDRDYINMIVHPAVTDEGTLIENRYPRITTREAQTQLLMKSGETVVIGGLIKDQKEESVQGVPFLRKIPFVGKLFERTTVDTQKIELLIFITAHIVDDRELTGDELATLERSLGFKQVNQK